ncbi:MAG: hypothetical protein LBD43_03315 [Holosporales bacterium]|jgi:hypothetical protein|nr:hypothetical protein [Holosporales bacterium]
MHERPTIARRRLSPPRRSLPTDPDVETAESAREFAPPGLPYTVSIAGRPGQVMQTATAEYTAHKQLIRERAPKYSVESMADLRRKAIGELDSPQSSANSDEPGTEDIPFDLVHSVTSRRKVPNQSQSETSLPVHEPATPPPTGQPKARQCVPARQPQPEIGSFAPTRLSRPSKKSSRKPVPPVIKPFDSPPNPSKKRNAQRSILLPPSRQLQQREIPYQLITLTHLGEAQIMAVRVPVGAKNNACAMNALGLTHGEDVELRRLFMQCTHGAFVGIGGPNPETDAGLERLHLRDNLLWRALATRLGNRIEIFNVTRPGVADLVAIHRPARRPEDLCGLARQIATPDLNTTVRRQPIQLAYEHNHSTILVPSATLARHYIQLRDTNLDVQGGPCYTTE